MLFSDTLKKNNIAQKRGKLMDERLYRDAMGKFATGITIVATEYNKEIMAMTVNAFMSVSLAPKLIAISIDQKARMYDKLQETKSFGLSVLSENQQHLSRIFAKQIISDQEIAFCSIDGVPVLKDCICTLSCRTINTVKAGDHLIFIAEVTDFRTKEGDPVIFFSGKYRHLEKES